MVSVRQLVLAILPLLSSAATPLTTRTTDDNQQATTFLTNFTTVLNSLATATTSLAHDAHQSPPRPEIGGQRITEEWLLSLSDQECRWRFRMTAHELLEMTDALEIPDPFITDQRRNFSAVEALCLLCARFRSPGDEHELCMKYNRSQSAISEVVNELVIYVDDTWSHLLDYDHENLLSRQNLSHYAEAIHRAGAPIESLWGFMDCTIRQMCRPTWWQRQAYSGHKKYHALKFQAIMLPNGLIGHLFGPLEGPRNDNFLAEESGIFEKMRQYALQPGANENTPVHQRYFHIFGDPAYGVNPVMISPFAGPGQRTDEEQEWNNAMSAVRISVEHGFAIVLNAWPFLRAFWKLRLYASPIGRYYRVGVLLTNGLNCFHPNQVAQHFECFPPTLQEYFHH